MVTAVSAMCASARTPLSVSVKRRMRDLSSCGTYSLMSTLVWSQNAAKRVTAPRLVTASLDLQLSSRISIT